MSTEVMPIAVKKCPRPHDAFVTYVLHVASCLEGNAIFASASPTPAELKAAAGKMADANAKAKNGGAAPVADRKAKRKDIEVMLDELVVYVRSTVRANAADAAAAAAMILSAGLSIRKPRTTSKAPLAAKHGGVSGDVLVSARSVSKTAIYIWEYSLDQQSWTSLPQTMTAKTRVSGLTPGQTYYFRFRAQTRKGLGDYSDVVKLIAI